MLYWTLKRWTLKRWTLKRGFFLQEDAIVDSKEV